MEKEGGASKVVHEMHPTDHREETERRYRRGFPRIAKGMGARFFMSIDRSLARIDPDHTGRAA